MARASFDPNGAHPMIVNFADVGRDLLWRIHREALADPNDEALHQLLADLLESPVADPDWREVDLSAPSEPVLTVHLRLGDVDLRFIAVVTTFQAPQNVVVEELRVESWFPADDATAAICEQFTIEGDGS